ncbi:MAG: 30S ribosomal protein S12 methylthiotransferase RimO [Bacteroidales bacterium]|nr:30S ribosomal protein S12 methylthiotransferase RimO [Bacteroidales bacterium]
MKSRNSISPTLNVVTLGCSKNLVDSEKLLRQFVENGFITSHNSEEYTDVVIINTCGFILDAKNESIETILSYAEAKKSGFIRKLIVTGCLSQRYAKSLQEEIPEVDAYFGVSQDADIIKSLGGNYYAGLINQRIITTPSHYAFLKIAEGCNRNCSFCAIPSIRGKQVSIPVEDLVSEARFLISRGVKEIILIAQDLTSYGTDIYKRKYLGPLLQELDKLESLEWIRLHYTYPLGFPSDEIIPLMKNSRKICKYLDIPIQHISDKILSAMNRGHGRREVEEIINGFRKQIPGVALRTTIITGYPGETEEDFKELYKYIEDTRFDRLGVFTYSEEEDTPAALNQKDDVPEKIKEERKNLIMSLQEKISLEKNIEKIGHTCQVLIDSIEGEFYVGRTEFDSPEIDNEVLINRGDSLLKPGDFCMVRITDAEEFDLYGEIV